MHVQLSANLLFCASTVTAFVVIALAGLTSLLLPVGAVVVFMIFNVQGVIVASIPGGVALVAAEFAVLFHLLNVKRFAAIVAILVDGLGLNRDVITLFRTKLIDLMTSVQWALKSFTTSWARYSFILCPCLPSSFVRAGARQNFRFRPFLPVNCLPHLSQVNVTLVLCA